MLKKSKDSEILDITDNHDNIIGQKKRSAINLRKFSNIRTVNGFLVNSQGQLWIPCRTAHKKLFPSCLDLSVGGHVKSGEDYNSAFRRELKEELNIDPKTIKYTLLAKLSPYENHVSSFMTLYIIYTDKTPIFNTDDFSKAFWITPRDLIEKLKKGEPAKSDLQTLVEIFLASQK